MSENFLASYGLEDYPEDTTFQIEDVEGVITEDFLRVRFQLVFNELKAVETLKDDLCICRRVFEWLILEPRRKIRETFILSFREVFATIVCIRSLVEPLREDGDVDFSEDVYHLSFSFAKSVRPLGMVNVAR